MTCKLDLHHLLSNVLGVRNIEHPQGVSPTSLGAKAPSRLRGDES
ncbi:MAG: hypothetical protein V3U89_04875 [Methylophilaceae bacterium]